MVGVPGRFLLRGAGVHALHDGQGQTGRAREAVAEDVPVAGLALTPLRDVAAGFELLQGGSHTDRGQHLQHRFHDVGVGGELACLPDDLQLQVADPEGVEFAAGTRRVVAVFAGLDSAVEGEGNDPARLGGGALENLVDEARPSIA